jgi:hypothetical protein
MKTFPCPKTYLRPCPFALALLAFLCPILRAAEGAPGAAPRPPPRPRPAGR